MAAGGASASGHNSGSSPALESTLDRRFQTLNSTMESIQGLSVWCIEKKKHHGVIVRYWIKWLRKSEPSHRLNLFYLANDVIQNCKRKNAMVFRSSFTEVLPEAIRLISAAKDSKVCKSVARTLSIWEERSVYSEEFISQLRNGLAREKAAKAPSVQAVNTRAALKSKIVAEFVPSSFIDHLAKYRKSMDDVEFREKQLASMRVDVCSTAALKKLKDKAGGKRFSRDFEDGSTKLQEFVSFLDGERKKGPALMEALQNADIFYEMQYKEVKVVAKAYETFANRVMHLKRKLDSLKEALPDPNDSPVPSPVEDAPSPTGSESPFHTLGPGEVSGTGVALDEDDLIALDDAPSPLSSIGGSPPSPAAPGDTDNRDVEDMELSDVEETEAPAIIVEERVAPAAVTKPPVALEIPKPAAAAAAEVTQASTAPSPVAPPPAKTSAGSLASVDLGKISSILSTISNVMKNQAAGPAPRASPSVPTTPTVPAPPTNPLAGLLSRVDISPDSLLSALSKTQGLSTLLSKSSSSSVASGVDASISVKAPAVMAASPASTPSAPAPAPSISPAGASLSFPPTTTPCEAGASGSSAVNSLDSKIDHFLQGNPVLKGFNLGFPSVLPWPKTVGESSAAGGENQGGTPVRDEAGATPTQDEVMDTPSADAFLFPRGVAAEAPPWPEPNPSLQRASDAQAAAHPTDSGYAYRPELGAFNPADAYQAKEARPDLPSPAFFTSPLPPIPTLPPPPKDFMAPPRDAMTAPESESAYPDHASSDPPTFPPCVPVDYNHQPPQRIPGAGHQRFHKDAAAPPEHEEPRYHPYYAEPHEFFPEDVTPPFPERRVPAFAEHRPRLPRPPRPFPLPPHLPRGIRRPPPPFEHMPRFPGAKRPAPPFPFIPPKRPYLPPHY